MRKLISAGLAALLLVAAIPSHADALGGRGGRGKGKGARASSGGNWGAQKGKSAKSANAPKSGGLALGRIPKGSVPKLKAGGGSGGGGGVAGRRRVVAGTRGRATRAPAKITVNYNSDATKPAPKLMNGGLTGGSASIGSSDVGSAGHHRGGGSGKRKKG